MRQRLRPPNTTVIPRLVRTCALGRGIQYAAASRFNHRRLGDWIARSSRAMTPSVGRTVSTPSLRAQRLVRRSFSEGGSNPESFRGGSLDCFAPLAMTEDEVWAGSPDDTVIPREGGESSTPRPLGSITAVSGILDRPVEPGDDSECVVTDTPSRPRGAIRPSFALSLHPLCPRGRREGRVLTWHPRSAARGGAKKPHSSIQV